MQRAPSYASDGTSIGKTNKKIKNIFVNKIKSLAQISGVLPDFPKKEKKISKKSKDLSNVDLKEQRKEKNKEAAKKARQRKKVYIQMMEKLTEKMENWLKQSEKIEKQSNEFLQSLQRVKMEEQNQFEKYIINSSTDSMADQIPKKNQQNQTHILDHLTQQIKQIYVDNMTQGVERMTKILKQKGLKLQNYDEHFLENYFQQTKMLQQNIDHICQEHRQLTKKDVKEYPSFNLGANCLRESFVKQCMGKPIINNASLGINMMQAQKIVFDLSGLLQINLGEENSEGSLKVQENF